MNLCRYKEVFGRPNEGIHSHRFLGLAAADMLQTLLLAIVVSYVSGVCFWKVCLAVFVFAEIVHYAFCVDTAVIRWLRWVVARIGSV